MYCTKLVYHMPAKLMFVFCKGKFAEKVNFLMKKKFMFKSLKIFEKQKSASNISKEYSLAKTNLPLKSAKREKSPLFD